MSFDRTPNSIAIVQTSRDGSVNVRSSIARRWSSVGTGAAAGSGNATRLAASRVMSSWQAAVTGVSIRNARAGFAASTGVIATNNARALTPARLSGGLLLLAALDQ